MAAWIKANEGAVRVIGHSYGADTAAHVVADGNRVDYLKTVDPVGWTRPIFSAVKNHSDVWVNYDAIGKGNVVANFLAVIGGAWNSAPEKYSVHYEVKTDHASICAYYCSP